MARAKWPRYRTQDHLGNWYDSIGDMIESYRLNTKVYYWRRNAGWSLEDTLTKPVNFRTTRKGKRKGRPRKQDGVQHYAYGHGCMEATMRWKP